MPILISLLGLFQVSVVTSQAGLKVASLHPLITDVARQVAGQHAHVIQLIDPHADPHHFQPTPKSLLKALSSPATSQSLSKLCGGM